LKREERREGGKCEEVGKKGREGGGKDLVRPA